MTDTANEPIHLGALTYHGDSSEPQARAGRFEGQACVGAYDMPLDDYLFRKHRPFDLTWQETVFDGIVRLVDGSVVIFCSNALPSMPSGISFEPDVFRRRPGEVGLSRVTLPKGSFRVGSIGSGQLQGDSVVYTRPEGVQLPPSGSEEFEYRMGPAEFRFRQGEVLDVHGPKLGLTSEYYVPLSPYYAKEPLFEAHGTVLGEEIEYGFLFAHVAFAEFGTSLWEAYGGFAGFRQGRWQSDYLWFEGMNTYDNGERELIFLLNGLDDTGWVSVQRSPAPGEPFELVTTAREIEVSATRAEDGSKRFLAASAKGEWEFLVAAEDSPDSQWSWATARRVGDTRTIVNSAGFLDHIFPSLGEIQDGDVATLSFFDVPGDEFRAG